MKIRNKLLPTGTPRIPRKLKKALSHPCARTKWLAKSANLAERLWTRYSEAQMQQGQCQTLQARLYHYLVLSGCKHSWRNQTLKCEMPSGVKLCIFPTPKCYRYGWGAEIRWYGAVLYPNRRNGRVRYFDYRSATYLYNRLGKEIKELITQKRKEI